MQPRDLAVQNRPHETFPFLISQAHSLCRVRESAARKLNGVIFERAPKDVTSSLLPSNRESPGTEAKHISSAMFYVPTASQVLAAVRQGIPCPGKAGFSSGLESRHSKGIRDGLPGVGSLFGHGG